jgi:hypothetical protein
MDGGGNNEKKNEDRNRGRYTIHVKKSNKNLAAEFNEMQPRMRQGTVLDKVDENGDGEGPEKKPFSNMLSFGSKGKVSNKDV